MSPFSYNNTNNTCEIELSYYNFFLSRAKVLKRGSIWYFLLTWQSQEQVKSRVLCFYKPGNLSYDDNELSQSSGRVLWDVFHVLVLRPEESDAAEVTLTLKVMIISGI